MKKKYGVPKTPFQRLIDSKQLTLDQEKKLKEQISKYNPFIIQKNLEARRKEFNRFLDSNRIRIECVG